MGESRRLDAVVGDGPVGRRGHRGAAVPADRQAHAHRGDWGAGGAGTRLLRLPASRLEPVRAADPGGGRGQGAQPLAPGPRPRLPSADALLRLCRPVGRVQPRRRGPADRRSRQPARPGDAAVGARRVDPADARHHRGQLLGLLRIGLGRLVVLGPGRERLADAVARGDRAAALDQRARRARRT